MTAVAQDARSQARNRELALERLAQRLADALHVPRPRTKTRPTAGEQAPPAGGQAPPRRDQARAAAPDDDCD